MELVGIVLVWGELHILYECFDACFFCIFAQHFYLFFQDNFVHLNGPKISGDDLLTKLQIYTVCLLYLPFYI